MFPGYKSDMAYEIEETMCTDELHEVRLLHDGVELDHTMRVSETCLHPGFGTRWMHLFCSFFNCRSNAHQRWGNC